MEKKWTINKKYTFLFITIILLATSAYWLSCNFILPTSPPPFQTDSNNAKPVNVFLSEGDTKTKSPIIVNMSISNAPAVGETATIALSVTPLIDGPHMEVSFKVPDGIQVVRAIGTQRVIEEIRRPPSLGIRQSISLKAGETRKFEITIKILREGQFVISGGASILDPDSGGLYRFSNTASIKLDVGESGTVINPPRPVLVPDVHGSVGIHATSDQEVVPPEDDLHRQNIDETETTTKTPNLPLPDEDR